MKTSERAGKFWPSIANAYKAKVFLIASMDMASWRTGGGKEVARLKKDMGFVPKGRFGVVADANDSVVALDSTGAGLGAAITKVFKSVARLRKMVDFILNVYQKSREIGGSGLCDTRNS